VLNFYIIWSGDFAAAMFNPKDILIFQSFVNKPYSKIYCVFLGIAMGLIYQSI